MTKKRIFIAIAILFAIVTVVGIGGTIHTSYEYIEATIEKEFIGYLDEEWYTDEIVVNLGELPQWVDEYTLGQQLEMDQETSIVLEEGKKARLALYADLQYIEQFNEERKALTGNLVEQYSEFYYKPTGTTYLLPVYEGQTVGTTFDHEQIKK